MNEFVSKKNQSISNDLSKNSYSIPDYENMGTPIIKNCLKKFGIKYLPKKQAIKKLTEIYEYTHKKKSKNLRRSQSFSETTCSSSKNDHNNKKSNLIKKSESTQNLYFFNNDVEFKSCSKGKKEKILITDFQLKSFVNDIIKIDENLFQSILNYEPINYDEFLIFIQSSLKPNKFNNQSLMKVLDEFGITFTLKNSKRNKN